MTAAEEKVRKNLWDLQDLGYREFHSKLMPTVDKEKIIGVRTPLLRKFAKELGRTEEGAAFLQILPHTYYEEDNLHGFLIEGIKDYETCMAYLEAFLPYVDNWATCDLMAPKVLKKNLPDLLQHIEKWLESEHTYTIRFGIGMLMRFFLEEEFRPAYPALVAKVKSEEYYVNMMIAWYFATALAKQYEAVLPYLTERRLAPWTHNKTIQKSVESYRITKEQKAYLRTLRVKGYSCVQAV